MQKKNSELNSSWDVCKSRAALSFMIIRHLNLQYFPTNQLSFSAEFCHMHSLIPTVISMLAQSPPLRPRWSPCGGKTGASVCPCWLCLNPRLRAALRVCGLCDVRHCASLAKLQETKQCPESINCKHGGGPLICRGTFRNKTFTVFIPLGDLFCCLFGTF